MIYRKYITIQSGNKKKEKREQRILYIIIVVNNINKKTSQPFGGKQKRKRDTIQLQYIENSII